MEHKVIKTEEEYKNALKRLELIFDSELGTKKGDELELLSLLIDTSLTSTSLDQKSLFTSLLIILIIYYPPNINYLAYPHTFYYSK